MSPSPCLHDRRFLLSCCEHASHNSTVFMLCSLALSSLQRWTEFKNIKPDPAETLVNLNQTFAAQCRRPLVSDAQQRAPHTSPKGTQAVACLNNVGGLWPSTLLRHTTNGSTDGASRIRWFVLNCVDGNRPSGRGVRGFKQFATRMLRTKVIEVAADQFETRNIVDGATWQALDNSGTPTIMGMF